jgi:predicted Fe-S protein YdhL (DUF1289 family)
VQHYLDHHVVLRCQEFHGDAAQEQEEQDVVTNKSRQEARNDLEAPNADGTSTTDGSSNSPTTTTNEEESVSNVTLALPVPVADLVPCTPCTKICRYKADFYDGQVCIGCFREAFEIGTWVSFTPLEKQYALLDATDRVDDTFVDGSIRRDELLRQAKYWQDLV